jgi:hypothetical protein
MPPVLRPLLTFPFVRALIFLDSLPREGRTASELDAAGREGYYWLVSPLVTG